MKRRVLSFTVALALCLNLFPVWAFAADEGTGDGLCPHHPAHTDACGYAPPILGQECAHLHTDGCYIAETNCIHVHTAQCYPNPDDASGTDEPVLCTHTCTQDSGCITLTPSCPHQHDDACGFAAGSPGAPCTFVCPICPIEDLIGKLPTSVSALNAEQVQAQLNEIFALYDELSGDDQQLVDLSPCAALLNQMDGMGSAELSAGFDPAADKLKLYENQSYKTAYLVNQPLTIVMNGYTMTGSASATIQIAQAGALYFMGGGTVISTKGVGVEVQSGGSLCIEEPDVTVQGNTYALRIAPDAEVHLSAGTYSGNTAAIQMENGDFSALLEPGYTYYDDAGKPISPSDMAAAKKITVSQCTDHSDRSYAHNSGATTHTWTCFACKLTGSEPCTFSFAQDGTGDCVCRNGLTVVVDEKDLEDLVYNGTIQPQDVAVTVTLTDVSKKELVKGTDYTVDIQSITDAGQATVTVTGITFNGTFVKTYTVKQDKPGLSWDTAAKPVPIAVDYDGAPVEAGDLPPVKINIISEIDDLQGYLQYSHKKQGDTDYTGGLPKDAGTYEVIASLPEMPNFEAAVSDPIMLTIHKISPIAMAPAATTPTYNGAAQALVTGGALVPAAVGDGLEIKFAADANGPFSAAIPTGTGAGEYHVWYTVDVTDNYIALTPDPAKVDGVEILRKQLTPVVTLSDYTYLYDGGYKQPAVTVKDGDLNAVLPDSEYQLAYVNNRNVSTQDNPAKAVVTDKSGGNYEIMEVEVPFQITSRTQDALSITQKPNTIIYGQQFTLGTSGGSGSGSVTWKITAGRDVAEVDQNSGQVTITGHGSATVQATKSGANPDPATGEANYEDAIAIWEFTAAKKPVTATVTAEDKFYDGDATATVHAVVEQGVLPGDVITITGLTGGFDNENAGVDKPVTVVTAGAAISGNNSQHYAVSYSSNTVNATIKKAIAKITTPPVAANLTYNGTAQDLIGAGAAVDPSSVQAEYALSEDGPYSTDFPKGSSAGTYTVWYRIVETPNYTGLPPASVDAVIAKKPVSPAIALDQDKFVYDGGPKEPAVTLTEADGVTVIPAGEYTVAYSGNVNVGTATVTATARANGNYTFENGPVSKTFIIDKEQAQVIAAPEPAGDPLTFSNRNQKLVTAGTGSGGAMVYCVNDENGTYSADLPTGFKAAEYIVYYKVAGDANHSDSDVGHVSVTIAPKRVDNPTIELLDEHGDPLVSYTYDGTAKKPKAVVKDGSTVIDAGEYNIVYDDNIDAGSATVNITAKPNGNYTVTGSTTFVIQKADIVFNPEPKAANLTYDGMVHELLVPGTASGGEVLYALNSASSTYGAAIPTGINAGAYTVYYKVVGDENHNSLAVQSVSVTIQRKPLTDIAIELNPDAFEYDGTVKLPAVTVKDGKTVLPEEEYTWTCDVASPSNQGTYTITISDAPGGNYDLTGVTANTAAFTIGQTAQTPLAIEDKPDAAVYGDTFTLTTSGGSSGSAVTWSASDAATVDPSTGEVKITGVGKATITATNPGDGNYLPVSDQWTFTAAPKPVTASVTVNNKPYDGNTTATVASADINADLLAGDAVTINPASISAAFDTPSAGTAKTVALDTSNVQVTGADASKYDIRYPGTVTADITKAAAAITAAPEKIDPLTYSGQPQALVTAGQTNVGFLVYSLDGTSFSPEVPTGTDAGAYTVYYRVDETGNYTGVAVNAAPVSVTIAPKPVTPVVELSESSFLYDGRKKDPKVTVKDGKTVIDPDQYTVTWANDDTAVTDGLLTAAGAYTATITNVANGNYSFTAKAQVEIKAATQGALNITGKPEHVHYGDTITTLEASGGSGNGTVKWSVTAGSAEIDPGTGVLTVKGTGSVTVAAERTVPNYAPATDTWTFTVEPKPVVAEVAVAAKNYDGTTNVDDADITAAVKTADLVDPADLFTISGLKGAYADPNAGTGKTVTLDASKAVTTADTAKYAVSYPDAATGDINPRQVTVAVTLSGNDLKTDTSVTPNVYYYEYDGTDKTPTVKVTAADDNAVLAERDYSVSVTNNKNVGDATVTVTAKAGGNYAFADAEVKFAIRRAGAVLTSSPQAKDLTYEKGTEQELVTVGAATGGTVVYSLTDVEADYSENIPKKETAGTYTVYYKVRGDGNHADTAPAQVSATIKPKEITPAITLSGDGLTETNGVYSYPYDGAAKTPTVTVQDGGTLIDGPGAAKPEYSVSYRDNVNAGTATVTVSDANGGNYIVNGTASFTITRAAPSVTAPTGKTNLQYNGASQELVTAGVCGEGTVVYSVNGGNYSPAIPAASAVGTYTVDWKVLGDANHSDTDPAAFSVEIAKNKVTKPTITLSSDTFQYDGGQHKPAITVYDDHSQVIPEREYKVDIAGTNGNVGMVDVDTYTVTVTTPAASNYDMTADGTVNVRTFQIIAADQEAISITGTKAQVCYGDTIQLGVSGGTGSGTITWTITNADGNPPDSTISATGLLTVKDVGGPITVTVTRSRGGNYGDVSATWEFTAGKKPVTAVLTGVDKPYDGDTAATVTAKVAPGDLVFGDTFSIPDLTGTFDNANVGSNKTITITGSAPTISDPKAANYAITFPATATASILAAAATVDTAPSAVNSLTYDASQTQELVTAGSVTGGVMVYSLDGVNYTPSIPKAKDAGSYTVYYKAQGDGNHTDSEAKTVSAAIARQTVTPQIELTPPGAQYDGSVKRPEVTVRDAAHNVIPDSEYKATYVSDGGANWTDQGTYTVKVEDISGGNYVINVATANFTISTTAQNPLEIVSKPGLVYYGDTFTLSAVGGSGSGTVTWSCNSAGIAEIDANGFVTIVGVGSATITATKAGGGNYDTVTATYPFNALKKPVTAIVTADDKVYDSKTNAGIHVTWEPALVGTDRIDTTPLQGTFADAQAGAGKTVTITGDPVNDATAQKYDITIQRTATASIFKEDGTAPALTANDREYDGTTQDLVDGGTANTLYAGSRDGVYSADVPTGTNAGAYTVWYKEKGDDNHNDSQPQAVQVTITRKPLTADASNVTLSGSDLQQDAKGYFYTFDGAEKRPAVAISDGTAVVPAVEYTVSYSGNKNVGTATVTIASGEGGNYDVSGSVTFAIRKGGAQLTGSPQARDLTYTGQPQELVTIGTAEGGHIEYAVDGGDYGEDIPKETAAGTYTVTYKVVGDGNHGDNPTVGSVSVTIKPKEVVSPKVTVTGSYTYDGSPKIPADGAVEVKDGGTAIPSTEYTLSYQNNVNAGTATVVVTNANGGNYIVNGTGTFEIGKGAASVVQAPKGLVNLPYNGTEQALVEAGSGSDGTMVYALSETGAYSPAIPTGKAVESYTVWYKVQGDGNHTDSEAQSVTASIVKNTVTAPTIQVTPEKATFNGKNQAPTVTVQDDHGFVIDGSEYTVAYQDESGNSTTDLTNVGKYTLTITEAAGGNYAFDADSGKNTAKFEILPADQTALTITGTRERVYYGDTIQLGTTGGNGTVEWSVGGSAIADIDTDTGLLTIKGVGSVTVTATSTQPGYADQTAAWPFFAEKKPVTAVVTAASKDYDGVTPAATTVTARLQSSDLVGGDNIVITLAGHFEDANAGTDKKVMVDSTNPDFSGSTGNHENYLITYPTATTASIFKAEVTNVAAPEGKTGLIYTGNPQALVNAGSATGGAMEYSLDGLTYSASLPTGTGAGDYEVWYRVKGDGNHKDTVGKTLDNQVNIAPQKVTNPIIEFTPDSASYDGAVHKPAVTVKDTNHRVVPAEEDTVTYGGTDWKTASSATVKHMVTITDKSGGNYEITEKSVQFTILMMGQNPLSIVGQPGAVRYGDSFTLSTTGGSGTGAVTWASSDTAVATIGQNGLVKVLKSGAATITATKAADDNYGAVSVSWSFSAEKRPVTPIVTAKDKEYDQNDKADLVITWKDGDLLNGDTIALDSVLTGQFDNANAGDNKQVTIQLNPGAVLPASDKYDIRLPAATTASITPKAASVSGSTATELTYDGSEQVLVGAGVTATNGDLAYSTDGSYYTLRVPKAANAGTYTIWYKAQASGNYKDSPAVRVDVTIKPKPVTNLVIELSRETFDYDGTPKKPDVVVRDGSTVIPASEYTVSYSSNVEVGTNATVTISDNAGGNYTVSGSRTFTIKAGAAAITGAPQAKNLTYNGNPQELVTDGAAVNGHVEYSLTGSADDFAPTIPTGTNAGSYSVYYKVKGENGAADTAPRVVYVTIQPKPVNNPEIVVAEDTVEYTGAAQRPNVLAVRDGNSTIKSTEYSVSYKNNTNVGTATIIVVSNSGSNYDIYATATFEIVKGAAEFTTPPTAKTGLTYNGTAQELVNAGTATGGIPFYSLDGVSYFATIPTKTDVGKYTVLAKVQGDSKHEDSDIISIPVEIKTNALSADDLTVTLSSGSFSYTGGEHKPTVTVTDNKSGNVIPASEYTVAYSDNVAVGTATVTITSKGGNYSFTATAHFQITGADLPPLTITGKRDTVYYGDTIRLGATGGAGTGTVAWSSSDTNVAAIDNSGVVTTKKSGSVTVTAAEGGSTDTWTFYVNPKPVSAVVIAANKPYDGGTDATLTVTISSGLVGSDTILASSVTATGHFTDAGVGENKTVIITGLTVTDGVKEKYDVSWPATTTASITLAAAKVTKAPAKAENLIYSGSPLVLLADGGTAEGGELAYSLDGVSYSYSLPTAVDAGNYTVWYKAVAGDENHKDSAPAKVENVTIAVNTDTPTVLCTQNTFRYDGTEKTPVVVVRDGANRIIPEHEYTVKLPTPRIAVGKYTVTVKDNSGGNYRFDTPVTGTFEIVAASQNPLSIVTNIPTDVHYGDTFRLSAMGGSGGGAIRWNIAESNIASIDQNGVVTVTGTGGFTVEAYKEGADGYDQSNTASVPFFANPKPVTPVVTAQDKPYDGNTSARLSAVWKSGDLVGTDTIQLAVDGKFATADAGTNKQVTITSKSPDGRNGNYVITWPDSTTASIYKVDAKLDTKPADPGLTYTGGAQPLVTSGSTVGGIGTIEYSTSQNGAYSDQIPTGTAAGAYTVWYRVADSVNYTGIAAASIEVRIAKANPVISTNPTASGTAGQPLSEIKLNGGATDVEGAFAWADGSITAEAGKSYDVVFTPQDAANYNTVTIQVTAASAASGGGTGGTSGGSGSGTGGAGADSTPPAETNDIPTRTTIQNGTANTVLSVSDGNQLVREAVKNQSEAIVIKPEITSDVSKTQVSIPASTVGQIQSQTDAALTVASPIADVTIPNAALGTLSGAGGAVGVATEQVGDAVKLTLTANGQTVEDVPGGLTLSVPAEDAGPGTVAVLVHDDGTREVLQRSVVKDGKLSAPLDGSATVEIVDNGKTFSDVPSTSWAAEAVTFASARELFNGTSETTFSPDQTTSRAMVATVLYRLEGQPDQALTDVYGDVSDDAWYADSVAWAAENGIVNGYGDGQFGPNDSVTREQFVVMLWRYVGSPKATGHDLAAFTDGDQISGYALEALCWAVESGVLNGNGNGQLTPGGTATRAEAAQILKNFLENT